MPLPNKLLESRSMSALYNLPNGKDKGFANFVMHRLTSAADFISIVSHEVGYPALTASTGVPHDQKRDVVH